MKERRMSSQTAAVLGLFVHQPESEIYGREIVKETGIPSGSLYPILHRLGERGFLLANWESLEIATQAGRRPRLMYRLDPRGAEQALAALDASKHAQVTNALPLQPKPATA
jgi:PadR family transcriptional regulator PadR